ncbi:MAG: hypothetical protein ACYCS7_03835 [Acidimicrobiales bacterium]
MVVGDISQWNDFFPWHLLPQVFDLVTETWDAWDKPAPDAKETEISRRFRVRLKQAKDYKKLPFYVMREDAEDDFDTAEELGRKDIVFLPTHQTSFEQVYFVFECKRLNALVEGTVRALASEYVTEGMARFVSGQYARFMDQGGMIGYILDGRREHAMGLVEKNIRNKREDLKMEGPGGFSASTLRADNRFIRETRHALSRTFIIHHIFMSCPASTDDETRLANE